MAKSVLSAARLKHMRDDRRLGAFLRVERARRGFGGRVEVPVPAPRGAVELSACATRDARAFGTRLLHVMLRPLAWKRFSGHGVA